MQLFVRLATRTSACCSNFPVLVRGKLCGFLIIGLCSHLSSSSLSSSLPLPPQSHSQIPPHTTLIPHLNQPMFHRPLAASTSSSNPRSASNAFADAFVFQFLAFEQPFEFAGSPGSSCSAFKSQTSRLFAFPRYCLIIASAGQYP